MPGLRQMDALPLSPVFSNNQIGAKKVPRLELAFKTGHGPGDDLLSQDLSSHYHRRCSVSLPGSEWDRVVPPRSGHQRAIPLCGTGTLATFFKIGRISRIRPIRRILQSAALWHPHGDFFKFRST